MNVKPSHMAVCALAFERQACSLKGLKLHKSLPGKLGRSKAMKCFHFLEVIPTRLILFALIGISRSLVLIRLFGSQNTC